MLTKSEILKTINLQKIEIIQLWYVDILGRVKSIAVPILRRNRLEEILDHGISVDANALFFSQPTTFKEIIIKPDLDSFFILPWTVDSDLRNLIQKQLTVSNCANSVFLNTRPTARLFCDLSEENRGSLFSSRWLLKRALLNLNEEFGNQFKVGPKLGYHYFTSKNQVTDGVSYLDIEHGTMLSSQMRHITAVICDRIDIKFEKHNHGVGKGQQEIDFEADDALVTADRVVTYKSIVRDVARLFGVNASFMPKPFDNSYGNGMHIHQSLNKGNMNLFFDKTREFSLSNNARMYISGLLKYAAEITAITNQWINSYKRFVPDFEGPVFIAWAPQNRSTLIRVPQYHPDQESEARIEYRSPDPACNPYLAFASILTAGLAGIREGNDLDEPILENIYKLPEFEIEKKSMRKLPSNLYDALELFQNSPIMNNLFGKEFIGKYYNLKLAEWNEYVKVITALELEHLNKLQI